METLVSPNGKIKIVWETYELPQVRDPLIYRGIQSVQAIMATAAYDVPTGSVVLYGLPEHPEKKGLVLDQFDRIVEELKNVFVLGFHQDCMQDENGNYARQLHEEEIRKYFLPLADHFLKQLLKVAPDLAGITEAQASMKRRHDIAAMYFRHVSDETDTPLEEDDEDEDEDEDEDNDEEDDDETSEAEHYTQVEELLKESEEAVLDMLEEALDKARDAHIDAEWHDVQQFLKLAHHLMDLLDDGTVDKPNLEKQYDILLSANRLYLTMLQDTEEAMRGRDWEGVRINVKHTSSVAKILNRMAYYHVS